MENIISEKDFKQIKDYIYSHSGIDLAPTKRAMVSSRISKRLRHYKLEKFADYLKIALAVDNSKERQVLMDLLTTNETYFFREMGHFDYLKQQFLPQITTSQSVRIWSGASSTGEEAYSLSMLLADKLGKNGNWEIFGSDICTEVIKTARAGHYSTNRIDGIPLEYLKKYCLKGTGPYEGTLLVDPELRKKVSFAQVNLNTTLPKVVGEFDVVFFKKYFNLF